MKEFNLELAKAGHPVQVSGHASFDGNYFVSAGNVYLTLLEIRGEF